MMEGRSPPSKKSETKKEIIEPFIDKERSFGKKQGVIPPGVAPKMGGSFKGKWVWKRDRMESQTTIPKQREKDKKEFKSASEAEKKEKLYLLKTTALSTSEVEAFAVNNVRNRVEVANSALLNYFLGKGSAVNNTIAYSTYHQEFKETGPAKVRNLKYYLEHNGFVKEELASLYAGKFDTPKDKTTSDYNLEKMYESKFMRLRESFVTCGLMGFQDLLKNYDNFAFINGKLVITDTGVGSGITDTTSHILAGDPDFDEEVVADLDRLLSRKNYKPITEFKNYLKISDVTNGIEALKNKSKSEVQNILDKAFAPVPNPFTKSDPRHQAFLKYNEQLQLHKSRLYKSYAARLDKLQEFNLTLAKFYPTSTAKDSHVTSFKKLEEVDKNLMNQGLGTDEKLYTIYAEVNEKIFLLERKDQSQLTSQEKILYTKLQEIQNKYDSKIIARKEILSLAESLSNLQTAVGLELKQIQEFQSLIADLKSCIPEKWQKFIDGNLNHKVILADPKTDVKTKAMLHLNSQIKTITENFIAGKLTANEATSLLADALTVVRDKSDTKQKSQFWGKEHSIFGKSFQVTHSKLTESINLFLKTHPTVAPSKISSKLES